MTARPFAEASHPIDERPRDEDTVLACDRPPVVLTFLAPAQRCNQRCPSCYLTEVTHEPVRARDLAPADYARFTRQVLDADVPVLSIAFQGYEVTLPSAWPYVEEVFSVAASYGIPAGFITNGMLLHRYVDRLRALKPRRITVSLDGADPQQNDRRRGLPGAFDTTLRSLRSCFEQDGSLVSHLGVASCLYDEANARSLVCMPGLLQAMGIAHWSLGFEAVERQGTIAPAQTFGQLICWMRPLQEAAADHGIDCHVIDEFDLFGRAEHDLPIASVYDPEFVYRLDPTGVVRHGADLLFSWSPDRGTRWRPSHDNALEVMGYEASAIRWSAPRA